MGVWPRTPAAGSTGKMEVMKARSRLVFFTEKPAQASDRIPAKAKSHRNIVKSPIVRGEEL